jgi:hypothetical protein
MNASWIGVGVLSIGAVLMLVVSRLSPPRTAG